MAQPKPMLVVDNSVRRRRSKNKEISKVYGEAIKKCIETDSLLSRVDYFTRESLLTHLKNSAVFGRVATITRYHQIVDGVNYLIDKGVLTRPQGSRIYLCLPNHSRKAIRSINDPNSLSTRYYDHVLDMIKTFPKNSSVNVMQLVLHWNNEYEVPDLTEDNMRVLVRHTLKFMAKQGLLEENDDYSYTINEILYEE